MSGVIRHSTGYFLFLTSFSPWIPVILLLCGPQQGSMVRSANDMPNTSRNLPSNQDGPQCSDCTQLVSGRQHIPLLAYFGMIWLSWWFHNMDTISALLSLCAGNHPVTDMCFSFTLKWRLVKLVPPCLNSMTNILINIFHADWLGYARSQTKAGLYPTYKYTLKFDIKNALQNTCQVDNHEPGSGCVLGDLC